MFRRIHAVFRACALLAIALAGLPRTAAAQGDSDIFLVRLDGTSGVTGVSRVTNRAGYNNQPAFLRDGRTLLYTAIDSAGQADIWTFDLARGAARALTRTQPESEYSATHIPGTDRFAVIRVEADSTQRLWSFRLDGTDPRLVLDSVKPIGYQAWIDMARVAVFVLGSPATLRIATVRDGSTREIARGIGRALQPVPGRQAVSFTRRDSANARWIEVYDIPTGTSKRLIKPFSQNEYHVWHPTGALITATGSALYRFDPAKDADWVLIADLASHGVRDMSRLAISADGSRLAVVAAR
jgi:hypothetical protein